MNKHNRNHDRFDNEVDQEANLVNGRRVDLGQLSESVEQESLITSLALGELDQVELETELSSELAAAKELLNSDSSAKAAHAETKRLGTQIRKANDGVESESSIVLISGLKSQLEEALPSIEGSFLGKESEIAAQSALVTQSAQLDSKESEASDSMIPLAKSSSRASSWSAGRLVAVAATTLLVAGGCWWLMQVQHDRDVALNDGVEISHERLVPSPSISSNRDADSVNDGPFESSVAANSDQRNNQVDVHDEVLAGELGQATSPRHERNEEIKNLVMANDASKAPGGGSGEASPSNQSGQGKNQPVNGKDELKGNVVLRLEKSKKDEQQSAFPAMSPPVLMDSLDAITEAVAPARAELKPAVIPSYSIDSGGRAIVGRAPKSGVHVVIPDHLELPLAQNSFGGAVPTFEVGGEMASNGLHRMKIAAGSSANPTDESGMVTEMRELMGREMMRRRSRMKGWGEVDRDSDRVDSAEQYELPPENQFLRPIGNFAQSTFAIDVDTASYANARRFINQGQLPPPPAVRVEEFINYFAYSDKGPEDGKPFAVHMEVAGCPWNASHKLLRIGVKGKEVPRDDRPITNLVFLIDVSGSMSDQNKLPLLQRSMMMLVDRLTEGDKVSIVTYAGNAGLRLSPTSGDQKDKIRQVIGGLSSGGSTHGSAGIRMAYKLAAENMVENGVNRVILATDGDLNVGVTADNDLVSLIKEKADSGIFLTVLGFGTGNLKDAKLEKLADNGNGQYNYIDSIREARKVLVEEMTGSLITIAKDVKIQVEFNPAEISGYRLIGYENRALANQDFANDLVDAGDIGAGHTISALYELVPVGSNPESETEQPSLSLRYQKAAKKKESTTESDSNDSGEMELTDAAKSGELVAVSLRFKQPDAHESELIEFAVKDSETVFDEATENFRFSAAVANFGMQLRRSKFSGSWKLSDIQQAASTALGADEKGHRAEFMDLVRQAMKIVGQE